MCESAGTGGDTDALARAGRSIQAAFRHWNNKTNWNWLRLTTDQIDIVPGTDTYTLPVLCKAVHTVRIAGGYPRALVFIQRRLMNKMNPKQDFSYRPWAYDLFRSQSDSGKLRLIDIPDASEPMFIDYYRQMVVPMDAITSASAASFQGTVVGGDAYGSFPISIAGATVGSVFIGTNNDAMTTCNSTLSRIVDSRHAYIIQDITQPVGGGYDLTDWTLGGESYFLDVPADYEDGILAMATYLYLINKSSGGPRLQYWQAEASRCIDEAMRVNVQDTPDEEMAIMPPYLFDNAIPLGPNDIRWANIGW